MSASTSPVFPPPDIRVGVQVRHRADRSTPERQLFQYLITLENRSDSSWQLLSRSWVITDGRGQQTLVQGEGVVGQQPILPPGGTFSYDSFVTLETAPLETRPGTMRGFYTFRDAWGAETRVPVPTFTLALPPQDGPETRTLN